MRNFVLPSYVTSFVINNAFRNTVNTTNLDTLLSRNSYIVHIHDMPSAGHTINFKNVWTNKMTVIDK